MATYKRFEDLKVWQESRLLNKKMFVILSGKSDKNLGFLINHLFKTSGSIMDNIAEGFYRQGNKEFRKFLSISKGSAGELRSQIYRALDIEVISEQQFQELYAHCDSISAQLHNFIQYLNKSSMKGSKFQEPEQKYKSKQSLAEFFNKMESQL